MEDDPVSTVNLMHYTCINNKIIAAEVRVLFDHPHTFSLHTALILGKIISSEQVAL